MDLFAFEKSEQWTGVELEVREIVPIAPVDESDVLRLAARAHWPEGHPAAAAIQTELGARRVTPLTPAPDEQWHPKPHRGLEGTWGQSRLIVGNETMIREAGIERSSAAEVIVDCHRREDWTPVLIAAQTKDQEARSSLIGIIAIGPPQPVDELPDLELIPPTRKRTASTSPPPSDVPHEPGPSSTDENIDALAQIGRRWSRFPFDWPLTGRRVATIVAVLFGIVILTLTTSSLRPDRLAHLRPNEIRTISLSIQTALTGDVDTLTTDRGETVYSMYQWVTCDAQLRYRVSNATRFLSVAAHPERLLDRTAESILREQIGTIPIDDLLTSRRGDLAERTTRLLQAHWDPLDCGIEVYELAILDIRPVSGTAELPVAQLFEAADQARTDSFEQIADAQLQRDRMLSDSRTEAHRRIAEAQRKSTRRIEAVRTRIERYHTLQATAGSDPETQRRALILDLLAQQLRESKVIVLDAPDGPDRQEGRDE